MKNDWKEFKELLETALKDYDDPNNIPCYLDPNLGSFYRRSKQEALVWVLEMIPDDYVKNLEKKVSDYGWEASARHAQNTGGTM